MAIISSASAYTFRHYIKGGWNRFDFALVVVSIASLIFTTIVDATPGAGEGLGGRGGRGGGIDDIRRRVRSHTHAAKIRLCSQAPLSRLKCGAMHRARRRDG